MLKSRERTPREDELRENFEENQEHEKEKWKTPAEVKRQSKGSNPRGEKMVVGNLDPTFTKVNV